MRAMVMMVLGAMIGCGDGAGTTDVVGDATTTPDTDADNLSLCDPAHAPVTPVAHDDATYTNQVRHDCYDGICQCDAGQSERMRQLLACEPLGFGWYEPFGSTYLMTEGRENDKCVILVGVEVEGGIALHRCKLPFPVAPWQGLKGALDENEQSQPLAGIEDQCELATSCCILEGCPNPCDGTIPECPHGRIDNCQ